MDPRIPPEAVKTPAKPVTPQEVETAAVRAGLLILAALAVSAGLLAWGMM